MIFFFVKQKTAYEMRISDWSSDVCSSDLPPVPGQTTQREWRSVNGFSILVAVFRIAAQEFLREIRAVIGFIRFGVILRTPVGRLLHRTSPMRFFWSRTIMSEP